ncbi:Hypothetical protein D9617_13g101060 [Elsinoe fawcettii]|nr:Hypothetical protein D9617_13g101060 [Elsinoe fawcettii]
MAPSVKGLACLALVGINVIEVAAAPRQWRDLLKRQTPDGDEGIRRYSTQSGKTDQGSLTLSRKKPRPKTSSRTGGNYGSRSSASAITSVYVRSSTSTTSTLVTPLSTQIENIEPSSSTNIQSVSPSAGTDLLSPSVLSSSPEADSQTTTPVAPIIQPEISTAPTAAPTTTTTVQEEAGTPAPPDKPSSTASATASQSTSSSGKSNGWMVSSTATNSEIGSATPGSPGPDSSMTSRSRSKKSRSTKTPIVIISQTATTSEGSVPSFAPKDVSCPKDDGTIYTAANNRQYVIACGIDHAGGNIGMVYVNSFQDCIERCAANTRCVTVSLSGAACYMKGNVGVANQNTVWGAREVGAEEASSIENRPTSAPASSGIQPSSTASPDGSRSCKDVGNSYGDAASGRKYTVACASDLPGQGDFAAKYSPSFEGCFTCCAAESTCTAFSYFGGICYLKALKDRDINVVSPSGADLAYMGTAAPPAPSQSPGATCRSLQSTYTINGNRKYKVKCGHDEMGFSDIGNAFSRTFSACFELCDKFKDCVGFAYAAQTCYFKSRIGQINDNYNVDLAFLSSTSTDESPTTKKSKRPHKTTMDESTASPMPGSCKSFASKGPTYQKSSGPVYQLYCQVDIYGGDYDTRPSDTYEGCFDICTQDEPCVAFAYRRDSKTCYLKDEVNEGRLHSGVDSASIVGLKPVIKPSASTGQSSTMFSSSGASSITSSLSTPVSTSFTGAASTSSDLVSSSSASPSSVSVSGSKSSDAGSSTGSSTASGASPSPSAGNRDCGDLTPTYTSPNGPEYTVLCNTDYSDGDYRNQRSDTYEGCFAICSADPECLAFSYHEQSDICYLKNKILNTYEHAGVNSGSVIRGKNGSSSSISSGGSLTASSSISVSSATGSPSTSGVITTSSGESASSATISTTKSSQDSSSSSAGGSSMASSTATQMTPKATSPTTSRATISGTPAPSSCAQLRSQGDPYDDPTDDTDIQYKLKCRWTVRGRKYYSKLAANSFARCLRLCTEDQKCTAFTFTGGKKNLCVLYDGKAHNGGDEDDCDSGFVVGQRGVKVAPSGTSKSAMATTKSTNLIVLKPERLGEFGKLKSYIWIVSRCAIDDGGVLTHIDRYLFWIINFSFCDIWQQSRSQHLDDPFAAIDSLKRCINYNWKQRF